MKNSVMLRVRAARCREIARDYHHSLAADLVAEAERLEDQAETLDRRAARRGRPLLFGNARRRAPALKPG